MPVAGCLFDEASELRPPCVRQRTTSLRRGRGLAQDHVAPCAEVSRRGTHADIPGLRDGTDVDVHVAKSVSLPRGPLDGLLQGSRPEDAEAGGQFVVAFKGTVDHGARARRKPEPHAVRAGAEPLCAEEHARLRHLAEQRSHARDQLRARDRARLPLRAGLVHDDESHALQLRPGTAATPVKNSATAGARTPGFTLCVCPGNSP